MLTAAVLLGAVVLFLIWDWSRTDNDRYKPGKFYYTKKWLFLLMLWLNGRRQSKEQSVTERTDRRKRGRGRTLRDPELLEAVQNLEEDSRAIDTVYFYGSGTDGTNVVFRVARTTGRMGEVWVMLDLPGIGFLQHPLHPDTTVYNMGDVGFTGGGCRLTMLEPMSRWHVSFSGMLRHGLCNDLDNKKETYLNVKVNLKWAATNDPFNFDVDMDNSLLADAIAREKWTSQFWKNLKGKHQTHYEQLGELSGVIEVEGYASRRVHLRSLRDHTFGVRDWEIFYRYAIHFVFIEEAIDTVYFYGSGTDGTNVVFRVARTTGRMGEVWVMLDLPGIGFLQHPLHPDTTVYNMGDVGFTGGGCRLTMLEPMSRWHVSFSGMLRHGLCNDLDNKKETYLNVKVNLKWAATNDPFNFDVDMDNSLLADAIAREKWTSQFWKNLKGKHQTHYEQLGELSGVIEVEGYASRRVHLRSLRDHTFGVRDWEIFYRYAIHFVFIEEAIDTVYFYGSGTDGTNVVFRVARTTGRMGEVWVMLDLPGIGFLQHPLHPDTTVYNMGDVGFTGGGCRLTMLEPMSRWHVSFSGMLRHGLCNDLDNKKETYLNVKVNLKWAATNDPFNFDVDMDNSLLADAIAREKWTSQFWKNLKGKHQTHYEQLGELSGVIEVEGYASRRVHLRSLRDHTFGVRDWEIFYRYAIHFVFIEEAIDTVYFYGSGTDGTNVVFRVARTTGRMGEVWVMLDLPGIGFLQHPLHPDTTVYNMGDVGFTGGGCRLTMLEPMSRWHVSFSGMLRHGLCNDLDNKKETYLNVKVNLKWAATNDPFNFDVDMDNSLLADAIAREKWTSQFWKNLKGKHQTHYEQLGELSGVIEVEGYASRRVHLRSLRDHTFGVRDWEIFYRYAIHFVFIEETGVTAMVAMLCMPGYMTLLKTGYLVYASGETFPVTAIDMDLHTVMKEDIPLQKYSFMFEAGGERYNVELTRRVTPVVYHYRSRSSRVLETFCTYSVNGLAARGLTEYHYRNPDGPPKTDPVQTSVSLLSEPNRSEVEEQAGEIILTFCDKACQSNLLVGGKGAQLALLTSIQDKVGSVVPRGLCFTLAAFNSHLKENKDIEDSIQRIIESIRDGNNSNVQELCSDTMELLASSKISHQLERSLMTELRAVFGDSWHDVSLAVRSSAAGEDGGEASSAGQMETFLGVKGGDKILEAVRKCWVSAYTFQAVEYRRQHGQPIRTSVGVVIQEMVQSEVSGVLFTNCPITGSPNKMVMDASYGLGEAVVSGKSTPDTIVVERLGDDRLTVKEKQLGNKNMLVKVSDSGDTVEMITTADLAHVCCLTDEQILALCHVAIKVENYFGSGRDVEWAIKGDQIYLLQARPITTTERESDDDFVHEFDSPLVTGKERMTLGNIGEMMPGCITPLSNSVFRHAIDVGFGLFVLEFAGGSAVKNASKLVVSFCGRLFINLTLTAQVCSKSIMFDKKAMEMNLLGEVDDDHGLQVIKMYGYEKQSLLQKIYIMLRFMLVASKKHERVAQTWYQKVDTYEVGAGCQTAQDLYRDINQKLPDYYQIWLTTACNSGYTGNWTTAVMGVVSGGKPDWTTDNFGDVALLLAQCQDVYSAEVPAAMQDIARALVDAGVAEEFCSKTDAECATFLAGSECPQDLKDKYETFLVRHGHRCVREAEFMEKSWRAEPEKLMTVLKAILKSEAYKPTGRAEPSVEEAVQNLKSPISYMGRLMLKKFIVPKARKAVGGREFGKSIAVKVSDKFKQAYWKLSDMLVKEGRLPDGELMFFLTHQEIGQLIETRSARLITRAVRRRKVLPIQSAMEFTKLFFGRPQPVTSGKIEARKSTFSRTGMPVSRGSVTGSARVVKSLEAAADIQKGDILIVSYTDVGWSPYFPLISGLVTEMGGLVSHGAVVAREYGLPCVVNMPNATHLFQTGDKVHLDGAAGTLCKLED